MNIISSEQVKREAEARHANPSIDEIHRVRITAGTAMMSVLRKNCGKSRLFPGRDEVVEVQRCGGSRRSRVTGCRRTAGGRVKTPTASGKSQTSARTIRNDVQRRPAASGSVAAAGRAAVRGGSGGGRCGHAWSARIVRVRKIDDRDQRDHQQDDGDGRSEPDQARLAELVVGDQRRQQLEPVLALVDDVDDVERAQRLDDRDDHDDDVDRAPSTGKTTRKNVWRAFAPSIGRGLTQGGVHALETRPGRGPSRSPRAASWPRRAPPRC